MTWVTPSVTTLLTRVAISVSTLQTRNVVTSRVAISVSTLLTRNYVMDWLTLSVCTLLTKSDVRAWVSGSSDSGCPRRVYLPQRDYDNFSVDINVQTIEIYTVQYWQ